MTNGFDLREGNKTTCQHLGMARKGLVNKLGRTREFIISSCGTLRHVLTHDHVYFKTWFFLDYPHLTRIPGTEHVESKKGSPKCGRRAWIYMQCEGCLKAGSMGMRKVGSASIVPTINLDILISMMEARILWPSTKPKDANHLEKVRDWLECGEWKGIMAGSRGVKEDGCRRKTSSSDGPIYWNSQESKDLFKFMFILLLLPIGFSCDCTIPRLCRARARARGPNWGGNPSDASPSGEEDSTPHDRGIPTAAPFNWGDQYMAETPTAIEAFIAIMEIDLLRDFEALMGCPLLSNPF